MFMTIQSNVKDKILATPSETSKVENAPAEMLRDLDQQMEKRADDAQSEAFKQENALAERLHGLDQQMERKEDENNSKEWNSGDDQLRLRWMIYLVVLADAAESVRDTIGFEYCLASSSGWTKSPVLWAEIGESSLTGPELVLDTTDKVVLIKEKLKAARDRQKSYADKRRKPLEFEVGDRVLLKVSPWKGVKCLADANLHVPLNEIKIDKTLRFVEELVEIMDREIRNLKRSKIPLVKVHWNSKRGPEFTWEREDHMKSKYPQLFVDRAVESASVYDVARESSFQDIRFSSNSFSRSDSIQMLVTEIQVASQKLAIIRGIDGLLVVSVIISLLWIVDSERDRLIVVDRGTRSVPLFVMLAGNVSPWFGDWLLLACR
ncbi:hypothetical protein Tco_0529381 [Tanacetum coccineum]